MRVAIVIVIGAVVAAAASACGGSSSSPSTAASSAVSSGGAKVEVSTMQVPGLGTVLVNAQGHTLYSFVPDKHQKVTCVGSCAAVWPPLKLASNQHPAAAGGAKASLLGSDPDPSGGRVVTYAGWPLYTYVPDTAPGKATGQAINLNGGLWYVLTPTGQVVHTKPSGATGGY